MLTGQLRSQIDRIWDAFWSGGISNPLEVIEQITYLLFIRRLDDLQTLEENKADPPGQADGAADLPRRARTRKGRPYEDSAGRASSTEAPAEMFEVVGEHVFPFLRTTCGARRTPPTRTT